MGRTPTGRDGRSPSSGLFRGIEADEWAFYVEPPTGDRVRVIVATSPYGNKYVKSEADGDEPNNLLSLPECP